MPGIDDRLERDLDRAAGPAAPAPRAAPRRGPHRTVARKMQTVALVVVVLGGTAAGFLALQRNLTGANVPEASSTSTPSPSTTGTTIATPIPLPSDPTHVFSLDGLAFPVCRGSSIAGNFLGTGQTFAYVFTKASEGGCATDTTIVAVQVPSDAAGTSAQLAVGGPLDCQDPSTCFVWANPDIDGDGQDEIAIATAEGASTTSFELYEAKQMGTGWGLNPYFGDDSMPLRFDEGGSATHLAGTYCDDTSGARRFVSWEATSSDGSTYDISETGYELHDGSLIALAPHHLTAGAEALPPHGLDGCGGTIQNSSTS